MYTEQNIRGLAINFLRQHYKLRPRSGTSGTRVVHKPHYYEGVTIDARLAYQKPDLSWFTATVEASGVEQAHELLYRVNYFRIGAHALLVALGLLTLYLAGSQVQGESLWEQIGRPGVYFHLLNVFLVIFAVVGVLLSRLRYYRYIYAIAQFMRFYANAQWVAYDRQIFANVPDRYYRELQRQCLRFGFGLMEIQGNNKVRWLIEPSHIDQFRGERSRLPVWVAAAGKAPPLLKKFRLPLKKNSPAPAAPPPAPPPPVPTDGYTDPLDVGAYLPMHVRKEDYAATITPPSKGRKPWYKQPTRIIGRLRWRVRNAIRSLYPQEIRKRPGYYEMPLGLVALGISLLIALGSLAWLQSQWTPERRPGQEAAAPDLDPLESAASPAQSDADPEVLVGEYDHELSGKEFAERVEEKYEATTEAPIVEAATAPANTIHYFRYAPGGTVESSYGCGPLGRAGAAGFILLEGRYPVYEAALERAAFLNGQYEMPTAVLLADCLQEGAPGYLLYLGPLVKTEAEANLSLRRFIRDFDLLLEVLEV